MFMSTRYKKRDPDWKKRPLFAVEDSLSKLLNCLSIEYSVSKLISPKYKNFRSQKLKFESKTRLNNAIWRAWHIQYKSNRRPRFCQFEPPFSDQTVHSTPQAVILEGKTWKRRLDVVSRKYKKWRKFYNYKILKGENGAEENDNLKELSNENSEDEFLSEEEEETEGKLRLSPNKNSEQNNPTQSQIFLQNPEFMIDTFVADLPDTLFSSIRPVKATESNFEFSYTDLSDMIQPTLDQLNPCFDYLLENFDSLTDELNCLQDSRSLETVEEHPGDASIDEMMNLEPNPSHVQQGLLDDRMYTDPLDTASAYLYSSQFLLTSSSSVVLPKQEPIFAGMKSLLPNGAQQRGIDVGKRELLKEGDDAIDVSPPRKLVIKEPMDIDPFQTARYSDRPTVSSSNLIPSASGYTDRTDLKRFKPNFETILSNTIASSGISQSTSSAVAPLDTQSKINTFVAAINRGNEASVVAKDSDVDMKSVTEPRKTLATSNANARTLEYSELPPQLQAPNLTAHLQAVMSARTKPSGQLGAIPRNKSDTHLASLIKSERAALHASSSARRDGAQSGGLRRESAPSLPARLKRAAKMPRNMSDTSLVQLAKDSSKASSRRRQSSVSIDSRPILLPKNLSESNLCALALGSARRQQPILPKNLVAIAPSNQSKTLGIAPKVPVNAVSETSVSGGHFSTFVVNKQQPCNVEPVQVTLYMPKPRKATSSSSAINKPSPAPVGVTAANILPQRVEVIQYQGSMQESRAKQNIENKLRSSAGMPMMTAMQNRQIVTNTPSHIEGSAFQKLTPLATVGTTSSLIANNRIAYVQPSSSSLDIRMATTLAVSTNSVLKSSNAAPSSSQMFQAENGASTQMNTLSVTSSLQAALSATQVPAETKSVSIAPLQGLSEQQLVTLAQVLQGSTSGNTGQENTIAYLEMLQQQLNTLLMQQQSMLKSQQSNSELPQQPSNAQPAHQQHQQQTNVQQQRQLNMQQPQLQLQQQQQNQLSIQQSQQQQLNMQPPQRQHMSMQQPQQQLQEQQTLSMQQPQQQHLNTQQPQQQHLNTQQPQQQHISMQQPQHQHLNTQQPQQQHISMQQTQQQHLNMLQPQHQQQQQVNMQQQQQLQKVNMQQSNNIQLARQNLQPQQQQHLQQQPSQTSISQTVLDRKVDMRGSIAPFHNNYSIAQSILGNEQYNVQKKQSVGQASGSSIVFSTLPTQTFSQQLPVAHKSEPITHNEALKYVGTNATLHSHTSGMNNIVRPESVPSSSQSFPPYNLQMNTPAQPQQRRTSISNHPQFVHIQNVTQSERPLTLSTVDTAIINLTGQVNKQPTQLLNQLSGQHQIVTEKRQATEGDSVATTAANIKGVTTGADGTTRPTMVDLALAASQRSYLADPSSTVYSDTHMESMPGSRGSMSTSVANLITTSTMPLPIPTVVIPDSLPSNGSESSAKRSRVKFENRDTYKEYRRRNHVTAEQKRRGLIKIAFDQMISLIPSMQADKQGRTSKALILQKGADYIEQLQREQQVVKGKVEELRKKVSKLNEEIKICQQQLPAGGAVSEQDGSEKFYTTFLQHIRERIVQDHKYWIFAVMIRPLLQSFHETVVVGTLQDFIKTVLQWFDDYCALPVLRPVVISTLTQFSTNTAILSDPASLPSQALEAAGRPDPTLLGQPTENVTTFSNPQTPQPLLQQSPAQQLNQDNIVLPGQSITWTLQPHSEQAQRK